MEFHDANSTVWRTDMTITGKMNPEDDTIFLRVQIADAEGMELPPYTRKSVAGH